MNKSDYTDASAPELLNAYAHAYKMRTESGEEERLESRPLFYRLNQPALAQSTQTEAYAFIRQGLTSVTQLYASSLIQPYDPEALTKLRARKNEPLPSILLTTANINHCLNQAASIMLTQPCWLQGISQASSCQAKTSVHLMSIYLQLTRQQRQGDELTSAYNALLLASNYPIPALHSQAYAQQSDLMSSMFDFASTQLALAKFPRVFLPEILGFTLAYCQMPTLIENCFPDHGLPALFFQRRSQRAQQQHPFLLHCITDYLASFPEQQEALWQRLLAGFCLYQLRMQQAKNQFQTSLENPLLTQQAIARLFQHKASAAIGHHQKVQLNGKNLDAWFAGMPDNSSAFLQALKQSNYVNTHNPEQSLLLRLFEFNGPMYGVLDNSDITLVKSWLQQQGEVTYPRPLPQTSPALMLTKPTAVDDKSPINYASLSHRKLYYYLLNVDLFADVLPVAHMRVSRLLQACRLFSPLPFKAYSHQQFDTYIETLYQQEMQAYKPLQGAPRTSKSAYIWGLEQIAPMILIDGCWLQNSLTLKNIRPEIADILFNIYADEIGNGHLQQNHPYIFQQLLDSLSISLPPVHSTEFVNHPGFIASAFDLPVYMLSLSSFSVEFLPELLGLNMAIELSGLGKGYLNLVDEWTYWGIDSTIATLHISIDNAASGHTFLAKKAIQLYLDDILQSTGDNAIVDRDWRRIYTGYASLRFIGSRFKWHLPIAYLMNNIQNRRHKKNNNRGTHV